MMVAEGGKAVCLLTGQISENHERSMLLKESQTSQDLLSLKFQ
jgi:hypothetical protein